MNDQVDHTGLPNLQTQSAITYQPSAHPMTGHLGVAVGETPCVMEKRGASPGLCAAFWRPHESQTPKARATPLGLRREQKKETPFFFLGAESSL